MGWLGLISLFMALAITAPAEPAISEPVTIEKVLAFLQAHPQVRTLDALLAELPNEFLSNYTLLHESHSLQTASPEKPRAIVYGKDARFVIAFNGDPSQTRYRSLETMQFRDDGNRFEMREIDFPEGAGAVSVSEVNPPLCLQCHFSDPRPNWEHYNIWPGAYGTNDDELSSEPALKPALQAFIQQAPGLDRYRHLAGLAAGYADEFGGRTKVEHNIVLTHRLTQLNFKRIARQFRETKNYDRFKYLMVATVWCGNFDTFFPTNPTPAAKAVQAALTAVSSGSGAYYTGANLVALGNSLGLEGRAFYTDFVTAPSQFSMLTPLNPQQMISYPMLDDPELKAYFTLNPSDLYGENGIRPSPLPGACDTFAQKSRAALEGWNG